MPEFQSPVNAASLGPPVPTPPRSTGVCVRWATDPGVGPSYNPCTASESAFSLPRNLAPETPMTLKRVLAAAALAVAASPSLADAVVASLDLSTGNARFGRDTTVGSFTDTYTFTLLDGSYLVSSTASSAASGSQDLDYTSLMITDAFSNPIVSFAGNLGSDRNEFYALSDRLLAAGTYQLVVRGVNSPAQASYSGNLAISAAPLVVPEPGSLALLLAGLGGAAVVKRRGAANQDSARRSQ